MIQASIHCLTISQTLPFQQTDWCPFVFFHKNHNLGQTVWRVCLSLFRDIAKKSKTWWHLWGSLSWCLLGSFDSHLKVWLHHLKIHNCDFENLLKSKSTLYTIYYIHYICHLLFWRIKHFPIFCAALFLQISRCSLLVGKRQTSNYQKHLKNPNTTFSIDWPFKSSWLISWLVCGVDEVGWLVEGVEVAKQSRTSQLSADRHQVEPLISHISQSRAWILQHPASTLLCKGKN